MSIHETKEMPDITGTFLLICPALEVDAAIIHDFDLKNSRQITTGTYPRVLHELAYKVVATIAEINTQIDDQIDGGLMSAIVEWGPNPQDIRKVGLLFGPLELRYNQLDLTKTWNVPDSWIQVLKF
jgi:hypothetical protein